MANSTTVKIDGAKLKELLESATGKSLYEIALVNGFSRNTLKNAVKNNYASATIQALARLYGIEPEEYKVKDPEPKKEPAQISIDDIEAIKRDELKALVKEALIEVLNAQEFKARFDPHKQTYEIYTRVKEV